MTTADDIFEQSFNNVQRLGLRQIPFTESTSDLITSKTLRYVFTGREQELLQVFTLFQSRERRRILVYGRIGIGKSAFLLEVLSVLRRKRPQMLTAYISLQNDLDLATTALIALAQGMPDDDFAQWQLHQMGIPTDKEIIEENSETGISAGGWVSEKRLDKTLPIEFAKFPTVSFNQLLERAQQKYSQGVVIAIDDLDKQEPRRVRELMHDAQGLLKGQAWFMLTAHPYGITGDLLTSERGLFDLKLKLDELDHDTTYKMLINYLNSARINNDCDDPEDPKSVLPFLPETAKRFCEVSLGKPRLFNRLGNIVLSTAATLQAEEITPEVLKAGLRAAEPDLRQRASLRVQEERIRSFLNQKGRISDETITIEDLEQVGLSSFTEMLPYLERLEEADLAYRSNQEDETAYEVTPLADPEWD